MGTSKKIRNIFRLSAHPLAEQIRAARKAAAPPPPLPSEQQETTKALTSEERRQLDKAAGWIKDKDKVHAEQVPQMVDANNLNNDNSLYSNNAYSIYSRNQQGDQQQQQLASPLQQRGLLIQKARAHTATRDTVPVPVPVL